MKKSLHISLRGGEKIFVNGAILRVDRKCSIELLNDVRFLLEGHMIEAGTATTPLRQLYFFVQTMLIDPSTFETTRDQFRQAMWGLASTATNPDVLIGLAQIAKYIEGEKLFEALKLLRGLFRLEEPNINCASEPQRAGTP